MPRKGRDLTEGNITKQLYQLTWPMLLGMMGMVVFNLVDTYFVGQLGIQELAAMSFSFPVIMLLAGLSQGVGIGTSSLVSRNIISTDREEVKKIASRAILLGFIIVLVFSLFGLFTIRPVFSVLGAEDKVLDYVFDYMFIWYLGIPFVVVPMIGNNIIRATGDTFTPGMLMVFIAVINVILDPLFIFGYGPIPQMGIKGAALATVIARAISLVVVLYILIKKVKLFTLRLGSLKEIFATWKEVLYIAGPASLAMLIIPVSIGFITKILAGFGKEAVAAFGVASRIEMFVLMVIAALGSVMIIFVGQNMSKQKFQRILKALRLGMKFSMFWGLLTYIVLIFFGENIAALFTDDQTTIEITKTYFYIIGASYGFQGMGMLSSTSFNGLNKPHPSTFFSLLRMLVLFVPLAWVGSQLIGVNGIMWAGLIANIVVGGLAFSYLLRSVKKMNET